MSEYVFKYDKDFARLQIFKELESFKNEGEVEKLLIKVFGEKPKPGDKKRWYGYDAKPDNKNFPSLSMVLAFARALRKPIDYFIYEKEFFSDLIKNKYIEIPYIESITNSENELIIKNNKCICAMRYEFLLTNNYNPSRIVLLKIDSDVMENTLLKGDEVIIDTSKREIKDGLIYAFNSFDIKYIRLRRFFCEINTIQLIADNDKKYGICVATKKDINIIGQVIMSKHCF